MFQSPVLINRAMERLVFFWVNMVPRYGVDDTIQRVTIVYILFQFLSSAVFIKFKSQNITTAPYL